jgi:hypothetical protein
MLAMKDLLEFWRVIQMLENTGIPGNLIDRKSKLWLRYDKIYMRLDEYNELFEHKGNRFKWG